MKTNYELGNLYFWDFSSNSAKEFFVIKDLGKKVLGHKGDGKIFAVKSANLYFAPNDVKRLYKSKELSFLHELFPRAEIKTKTIKEEDRDGPYYTTFYQVIYRGNVRYEKPFEFFQKLANFS